jgi:hypothetical protein
LLKELCGVSLKDNADLWAAFVRIRKARNTFVHGGVARDSKGALTADETQALLGKAREIIDFVKQRLPQELQWPVFHYKFKIEILQQIPIAESPKDVHSRDGAAPASADAPVSPSAPDQVSWLWLWRKARFVYWATGAAALIGIVTGMQLHRMLS